MTTSQKTALTYHEIKTPCGVPFVVIAHRDGRFPIRRVRVTAAGVVEMLTADSQIETIGKDGFACSTAILQRIRTHHDGLLLVQIDPDRAEGASEQVLTARLL